MEDKSASSFAGPVYTFLTLIISLIFGAFVWIVLSPLFDSLNLLAIDLFSGSTASYYPENVQNNVVFVFQFISYSTIVFVLFVIGNFLKKYLQPWTMEW
jgi:hypothetical protein